MPRLIGKQTNNNWYMTLILIGAIAAAGSLEYVGVIDVIPGFGSQRSLFDQSALQRDRV